jgi:peptidoglycan/xylan/chitin deacetylase (PgdA/CDA1 family)
MTTVRVLKHRLWNKWRRFTINRYARRNFTIGSDVPYVSFTFDDFPRSALVEGGRILTEHGVRGTYFTSFQLLERPSVSGPIASPDDVRALLQDGHEVGCHTFEHLDGCNSTVEAFERSIEANRAAFAQFVPGGSLPVFAYPLDGPVLSIKRAVGRRFVGCRFGGQSFNSGVVDLNLLNAYFLDKRNRGNLQSARTVIEQNAAARGWLIFATHDVAANPSPYGWEPEDFEEVVRLSLESGARVLPMMQACQELRITT